MTISHTTHRSLFGKDGRAWVAFAACSGIWGSTFLIISIGNDALAPVWAATLRLLLAALLLTGWAFARGGSLPRGKALHAALGYGVCQFGINFPLLYWGETVVPSGICAVFYATIPLSSAVVTRVLGMERLTASKVLGAVTAFAGVALLFSTSFRGHVALHGLLAVFAAATAAGIGTIMLKRGPRQDPIAANGVACAIGAAMSAAISVALNEPRAMPTTWASLMPLLYLTLAGSLGAFVIMAWLVHRWSITRVSYVSVLVPVIAMTLGTLVRNETVTPLGIAGAALVLAGLLIGMRSASASASPSPN